MSKARAIVFAAALIALLMMLFAGPGTKYDWWNYRIGLTMLAWAAYLGLAAAAAALVLVILLAVPRWRVRPWVPLASLIIALLAVAPPVILRNHARQVPPIHDITTDPIDPPRFEALAPLRSGDGTNTAVYAGLYSAEQQRLAYPNIETLELEVPVQRAYDVTLHLVNRRKWLVIDERPPQPPRRVGRIEAVARTPIMGFREDISIRVSADGDDSRIDIRSASRYFESDLGSNAARITKLIDDINEAVDNAPTPKQPAAKAAAKAGKK